MSKSHKLITVKSEPDESTFPVIEIVSPQKTKVENVKSPGKIETPRKSPRITQNVNTEGALPAKLVMLEIDWDKICNSSTKKQSKEYFMIMYGGKPVKIFVMPEGCGDTEGPVDQSSAKESDKSDDSQESKENVDEKQKEVKESLSSSNDISGIDGEKEN